MSIGCQFGVHRCLRRSHLFRTVVLIVWFCHYQKQVKMGAISILQSWIEVPLTFSFMDVVLSFPVVHLTPFSWLWIYYHDSCLRINLKHSSRTGPFFAVVATFFFALSPCGVCFFWLVGLLPDWWLVAVIVVTGRSLLCSKPFNSISRSMCLIICS